MKITIFTDGSSKGNPGPGGWGTVIIAADSLGNAASDKSAHVTELGGGEAHTTNNRMEITAALRALEFVLKNKGVGTASARSVSTSIDIFTDSSYLINGITKWVKGWQAKGWKTSQKEDVVNRDLWEALIEVVEALKSSGSTSGDGAFTTTAHISWNYVGGHIGIPGNERCDEIATSQGNTLLYNGPFLEYSIKNIFDVTTVSAADVDKKKKSKSKSGAKAYSYVSAVDGKVMTHATWAECEARVKGASGARFKKALNAHDEQALIVEFSK